jgi:hypothetical protein
MIVLILAASACLFYAGFGPVLVSALKPRLLDWSYEAMLKSVHVVMFFLIAWGWIGLWEGAGGLVGSILHAAVPTLAAAAAEYGQMWIPGHVPTWGGLAASLAGVGLAVVAWWIRGPLPPRFRSEEC